MSGMQGGGTAAVAERPAGAGTVFPADPPPGADRRLPPALLPRLPQPSGVRSGPDRLTPGFDALADRVQDLGA